MQVPQVQTHLDTLDSKKVVQSPHHDGKTLYTPDHESEIVRLLAFPISKITFEVRYMILFSVCVRK